MEADPFDESELFGAIERSGARALLIGRRALIVLGLPVLTGDYDFWIATDDAALFNDALRPLELFPNRTPEEARGVGRYVLENGQRIDVLVAARVSTVDAEPVAFEDVWERRRAIEISPGLSVAIPSIDDLILTKRFAARPKDAEDIRLLRALKESGA